MRHVMVHYRVKKDRVAEHEALIHAVFQELAQKETVGIRYSVFKRPDGVSFVHIAHVEPETNPLVSLAAFKAFTAQIADRCDEPPVSFDVGQVDTYGHP